MAGFDNSAGFGTGGAELRQPSTGGQESFLQRQKRLYGQQTATAEPRPQPQQMASPGMQPAVAANSPVQSDGRLAPPPPPAPAAPPAQPQMMGDALPPPQMAGPEVRPANIPVPTAPPMVVGALAGGPMQFTQYAQPNNAEIQNQQNSLMSQMLANPHSMSQENVAQLQAQQREQAALMAQQTGMQMNQARAASGTLNGGQANLDNRRLNEGLMSSILGGNRDIALAQMGQNRADELALLGSSNELLNGATNRGVAEYGARLGGQQAQAGENIDWANLGLNKEQLALQGELGRGGLNIDKERLAETSREFNLGHGLNINQFFENQRQANNNLGLSTKQLEQQAQQNMFNWLTQNYGR